MLDFFTPEPVKIIRKVYTGYDDFGNPSYEEVEYDVEAIVGVVSTSNDVDNWGTLQSNMWRLVFDPSIDLEDGDLFIVRDELCEPDGRINRIDLSLIKGELLLPPRVVIVRNLKGNVNPRSGGSYGS